MNELRNRGVEDLLLAVVDGLKSFPDAIRTVFPEAMVQTCIVGSLTKLIWPAWDKLRRIGADFSVSQAG